MDKKSTTWKKIDELINNGDPNMTDESMLRFLGLDSSLIKDLEKQSMETARESVKVKVNFVNTSKNLDPTHAHIDDSGMDLRADLETPVTIPTGEVGIVNTGLYFELPENYEIQVRPRSGLAAKNGVTVLNTPGTVDRGYNGEIKVILINLGKKDFTVTNGDRIAQAVVAPVVSGRWCTLQNKNKLSKTDRGDKGFGSTGIK
jgi:dUTP pyrophosphatase